jgi:hypothetical protein
MEGLLTIKELTHAVMVTMKGDSSHGCDSFTIIFLQKFWHDLQHITEDALNASFGNSVTKSVRLVIIKLFGKDRKIPHCQETTALSYFCLSSTS